MNLNWKIKKATIEGEPEILKVLIELTTNEVDLKAVKQYMKEFENLAKGQKELDD